MASPASVHAEGALAALKAGKPVYIEKPIAISLADAEAIMAQAARQNLVVACGHQERVVFQAMGLFDIPEQPLRLESVRHGTPSERSLDVSVVLDLMIHDLDLALSLSNAEPLAVEADGTVDFSGGWDQARAEVTFDDGFTAIFDSSRMAPERKRNTRVRFEVWGDGRLLGASSVLRWNDPAESMDVDIRGVEYLTLKITARGGTSWVYGSASWGEARVTRER